MEDIVFDRIDKFVNILWVKFAYKFELQLCTGDVKDNWKLITKASFLFFVLILS